MKAERIILRVLSLVALVLLFTGAVATAGELEKMVDKKLIGQSDYIEAVYVDGKPAWIEYKREDAAAVNIYTPPYDVWSMDAPSQRSFGSGRLDNGSHKLPAKGYTGVVIPLHPEGGVVDILAYDEVTIEGRFSGTWTIAVADRARAAQESNIILGELRDPGSATFQLAPLAAQLDLSQASQLILILKSEKGDAAISRVTFRMGARAATPDGVGVWIWDFRKIIGKEDATVKALVAQGLNRVYLQVSDDTEALVPFLKLAKEAGISVFALDGAPEYAVDHAPLVARLRKVVAFNRTHPASPFAGFQIDVEPHVRKDFTLKRSYYAGEFMKLVTTLRETAGDKLPLSVVIPFWFETIPFGRHTLAGEVILAADEVVLMSYRTDYEAVLDISRYELAFAEKVGKPVRLGLELTPLKDERHVVMCPTERKAKGALKLGGKYWQKVREYTVAGSELSFARIRSELPVVRSNIPPFASFAGWVLHSWEMMDK